MVESNRDLLRGIIMKTSQKATIACAWISFLLIAGTVKSTPIVYPTKGQSEAQQNKDEGECRQWAINKTGVDSAQLAAEANSGEAYQRHHTALGGAPAERLAACWSVPESVLPAVA
jgi:hypothetical protein